MVLAMLTVLTALLPQSAQADWEYIRSGGKEKGGLTISSRKGSDYVSVRQFCFAMGCQAFYQWANHRAIIQNKDEHLGAIVSPLAQMVLVDGKILDFEGNVLSELGEGYLLPINLAEKLALALKLGRLAKRPPLIVTVSPPGSPLNKIVIDPGHGGNDLGTGFGGINEKDVAIIYALKLREELRQAMPDLEVLLTREDDRYVSLPDRAKLANQHNANLFLSLHVNHAGDPKVEGVETYILSPEATDDEAKRLAILENDSWLKSANIKDAGDTVRQILVDMEQTKYIQDSALVASMIQQEFGPLDKSHGLRSRGVKQAMFYVLSQVAMPSTLVEMAFLSNTGDRSRLMDLAFRDEFVKSLVNALKRYREKTKLRLVK